eukprot:179752-Chlamydomonas_euryale.AAC.1
MSSTTTTTTTTCMHVPAAGIFKALAPVKQHLPHTAGGQLATHWLQPRKLNLEPTHRRELPAQMASARQPSGPDPYMYTAGSSASVALGPAVDSARSSELPAQIAIGSGPRPGGGHLRALCVAVRDNIRAYAGRAASATGQQSRSVRGCDRGAVGVSSVRAKVGRLVLFLRRALISIAKTAAAPAPARCFSAAP